jgi:hypothetical protein
LALRGGGKLKAFGIWMSSTRQQEDTMKALHGGKYPISERAQRANDVMIVSSFALWAMLLGFAPVAAWRLLAA